MSMARLWREQSRRAGAHDLLAPVYGWFTERFDTLDLKEAKALLRELASQRNGRTSAPSRRRRAAPGALTKASEFGRRRSRPEPAPGRARLVNRVIQNEVLLAMSFPRKRESRAEPPAAKSGCPLSRA